MPKLSPQEKAAKAKLSADKFKVRNMMVAGDSAGAVAYATKCGFNVFDARLPAVYRNDAEPFFQKLEAEMGIAPQGPPAFAEEARLKAKLAAKIEEPLPAVVQSPEPADMGAVKTERPSQPVPELPPVPVGEAPAIPAKAPVAMVRGWPVTDAAKIWGFCPNKALVVIELSDGRKVSMWKGKRIWQIYDPVKVRLSNSETADPIYELDRTPLCAR